MSHRPLPRLRHSSGARTERDIASILQWEMTRTKGTACCRARSVHCACPGGASQSSVWRGLSDLFAEQEGAAKMRKLD